MPIIWRRFPCFANIFQMGWNHQAWVRPVRTLAVFLRNAQRILFYERGFGMLRILFKTKAPRTQCAILFKGDVGCSSPLGFHSKGMCWIFCRSQVHWPCEVVMQPTKTRFFKMSSHHLFSGKNYGCFHGNLRVRDPQCHPRKYGLMRGNMALWWGWLRKKTWKNNPCGQWPAVSWRGGIRGVPLDFRDC